MVWVVDITDSKSVLKRIEKYLNSLNRKPELNCWYQIFFPEEIFPAQWTRGNIMVPVVFDCGYEYSLHDRNGEVFPVMPILLASADIRDGIVLWILRKKFVELIRQSRLHDAIWASFMPSPGESKADTPKKDMANKPQTAPIRDGKIPGTSIIRRSTPGYRRKMRRF